jgi:FkbM family methyltransferase
MPEKKNKKRYVEIAIVVFVCLAAFTVVAISDSFRNVRDAYRDEGLAGIARAVIARPGPQEPELPLHWNPLASGLDWLARQPSFSIVQLGAYVGNSPNDPLYPFLTEQMNAARPDRKHGAKVVLVEPIKEYFDRLRKNYAMCPDIQFANVAIAESEGIRDFYTLKLDPTKYGYPEWLAQLSSLKAERMGKLWGKYENYPFPEFKKFYLEHRTVEKVKCITITQLLQQYQIEKLDLLVLDVEGYEFEILKTLDFKTTRPRFIDYERVLLQENEPLCRQMLMKQGYVLIDWGQDTFCVRAD